MQVITTHFAGLTEDAAVVVTAAGMSLNTQWCFWLRPLKTWRCGHSSAGLGREDIRALLDDLSAELAVRGANAELILVGGAAFAVAVATSPRYLLAMKLGEGEIPPHRNRRWR